MGVKPSIRKIEGVWRLEYPFHPRMMWLFGVDAHERRRITEHCWRVSHHNSWESARTFLKSLYARNEVRR